MEESNGWARFPAGTSRAYETLVAGRRLVRSWVRREQDQARRSRLTAWQEIDLSALNRPGGRIRIAAELQTDKALRPVRLTIRSSKGVAVFRFTEHGCKVRLADGTRIALEPKDWSLVLSDNAPALFAALVKVLHDAHRLGFEGLAFIPGTLSSLHYSIMPDGGGWKTSLGEHFELDADGWIRELRAGPADVRVVPVRAPVPRWRTLSLGRNRGGKEARLPSSVRSQDVSVSHEGQPLWGRLVARRGGPARPRAAALIIGGSGVHDRFGRAGTIDLGYGELAAHLARHDVACLQFDKFGAGRTRSRPDLHRPRFEDEISLAQIWLDALRRKVAEDTPLFLVGHSQGGQVALALAAGGNPVAGIVLLATAARPIDAVIEDQVRTESRDLGLDDAQAEERVKALRRFFAWLRTPASQEEQVPREHQALAHLSGWYRGLLATTPEATLPAVNVPILIVQGDRDIQVSVEDARRLHALAQRSSRDATLAVMHGLDHLLKKSAEVTHTALYGDRRRHVSKKVTGLIAEWIVARSAGRPEIRNDEGPPDDDRGEQGNQETVLACEQPQE